jgi:hypothetical protein
MLKTEQNSALTEINGQWRNNYRRVSARFRSRVTALTRLKCHLRLLSLAFCSWRREASERAPGTPAVPLTNSFYDVHAHHSHNPNDATSLRAHDIPGKHNASEVRDIFAALLK